MTGGSNTTRTLRMMAAIARALATMSPRRTAAALILALSGAAVEGAGLLLLVPILGVLTGSGPARLYRLAADWGVTDRAHLVGWLMGGFMAMVIVRGLVLYARDISLQTLQALFVDDQRLRVLVLHHERLHDAVFVDAELARRFAGAAVLDIFVRMLAERDGIGGR